MAICVKDKPPKDPSTEEALEAWHAKSVDANVKQLYGAQKTLLRVETLHDETGTVTLPPPDARRIRLISVANPGPHRMPMRSADHGKGFVHAFSMQDLDLLSEHLDTIPDFLDYLDAREEFAQGGMISQATSEQMLLGAYLAGGRKFPDHDGTGLRIAGDFWKQFAKHFDLEAKRSADEPSYIWDEIAEQVVGHVHDPNSAWPQDLANPREIALQIARVNRFNRRLLGQSVVEVMVKASLEEYASRLQQVNDDLWVVLLVAPREMGQGPFSEQLLLRCIWAKLRNPHVAVLAIGLLSLPPDPEGVPLVVRGSNYFGSEAWNPDVIAAGRELIEGEDLYSDVATFRRDEPEYPGANSLEEE